MHNGAPFFPFRVVGFLKRHGDQPCSMAGHDSASLRQRRRQKVERQPLAIIVEPVIKRQFQLHQV